MGMTWAALPAALEIVGIVLQPTPGSLDCRNHNDLGSYEIHTLCAKPRLLFHLSRFLPVLTHNFALNLE